MGRSISVGGSDEVMAMLGVPNTFYTGKWRNITVTQIGKDEDTPLNVRKSLVGLTIPIIFDKQQLESQGINLEIPDGSVLAYATDVIDTLKVAEKHEEAGQLKEIAPEYMDMYIFEEGAYKFIGQT